MDTPSNYFECVPQDIRCIIVRWYASNEVAYEKQKNLMRMVLHPCSPFTEEAGILFHSLDIVSDEMADLLSNCRFFERFGRTINKITMQSSGSPIFYNQIKRYCTNVKELYIIVDRQGLWLDVVVSLSQTLEKLTLSGPNFEVGESALQSTFPKLESLTLMGTLSDGFIHLLKSFGGSALRIDLQIYATSSHNFRGDSQGLRTFRSSRSAIQLLKRLGGSVLCTRPEQDGDNILNHDSVTNVLRTHCPELQNFRKLHTMPIDEYSALLQHYGVQVRTAHLDCFRELPDLCWQILQACPNLRAPNYNSYGLDDLEIVASRLNGTLFFQGHWDLDSSRAPALKDCMENLSSLTEVVFFEHRCRFLMDCLAGCRMPSLKSLVIGSDVVDFGVETLRKLVDFVPKLRELSITSRRCTNHYMWLNVLAAGINLEELTFTPWPVTEDSSLVISSFTNIASAVCKHPKLTKLQLSRKYWSSSGDGPVTAEIMEAAQVLLRRKRILVKFGYRVLIDTRVPDLC